jgi:hypothetical protein
MLVNSVKFAFAVWAHSFFSRAYNHPTKARLTEGNALGGVWLILVE